MSFFSANGWGEGGVLKCLFTWQEKIILNGHFRKVRVSEYNNIRSQLNAINRKQTGSLAVRDLSNLVKPEDIVSSEHLTTLLAVVSKYSQKDWLASYETLTSYVVPRSSKKLYEDNEYALYTVTLFNRVADNFRTSAREKGFQIRDFEYSAETHEGRKQELDKLVQDQESLRGSLLQWCYTSYGEVFSSWMHFCAVRLFSESILRYGLPPSFLACVLAPSVKAEKKVRSILEGAYWKTDEDVGAGMAGLAVEVSTGSNEFQGQSPLPGSLPTCIVSWILPGGGIFIQHLDNGFGEVGGNWFPERLFQNVDNGNDTVFRYYPMFLY
ncbi:V-type proton ATPase subunit C-like protein, partial [Trifolium pratense]